MRRCGKTRCERQPSATASILYGAREVCLVDLIREPDPRFVDLCDEHIARLIAPIGWVIRDERSSPATDGTEQLRGREPIHR